MTTEKELKKEIEELKSEIKTLRPIVKRKYNEFKSGIEQGRKDAIKIIREYSADRENEQFMKEILLGKLRDEK